MVRVAGHLSRRRVGVGAGTIGVAGLALLATVGGPAAATTTGTTFTASASSAGLQVSLFGLPITEGKATVSADSSVPSATAEGIGELTPLLRGDAKASVSSLGTSQSIPQTCAVNLGGPLVGVMLQAACGTASASVDGSGNPQASASAKIAGLQVNVLDPIATLLKGGTDLVLQSVVNETKEFSNAPILGQGLLGTINQGIGLLFQHLKAKVNAVQPPNTLTVAAGQASASITSSAGAVTVTSSGGTLDVQILPGVGRIGPNLVGGTPAPLAEIKVAPATATSTFNGTGWTSTSKGSIVTVALNIPAFNQQIAISPGIPFTLLPGTPLETVIDLGSATSSGGTATANGVTIDLLKGLHGGVLLNLGSATSTGSTVNPATLPSSCTSNCTPTTTTPNTSPPVSTGGNGGSNGGSPAPAIAAATSPTAVHTGEWWSGSLPVLAALAALGGGLLGWPRLRRFAPVARLVARSHR